ncbi:pyruvate, phosphate dikinase [Candidatus Bandiella numerosa]|uniref:pyruvate, phosphate dikinase n=1 Tax=Candidatus Bandiella numerosa TaxID=2570586 RepID=UPI001F00BD3C|nr:pyruvate, phosphate dikinase [Candidatus Bandiella numerosa]
MNKEKEESKKYIFPFGNNKAEGGNHLKGILGNKGAGLAEMSKMKIPVPPGFTISSKICKEFTNNSNQLPESLKELILSAMTQLENAIGLKFGDENNPLLISVRSGAQISMPGMMETILNLGLNDTTVKGLAKITKNPRFAYDSYRRYIEMYSHVVLGLDKSKFEAILHNKKALLGIKKDQNLTEENLKDVIDEYKNLVKNILNKDFPQNITNQLWSAISAVFKSWNVPRAIKYRSMNNIPNDVGTAVNIQAMVFGNKGEDCATGVVFTRNPSTGENEIFGEYIVNAQGEDIVSGAITPSPINIKSKEQCFGDEKSLEELMPKAYQELKTILHKLELHYKDMQDVEFTIENGKCWILQTRSAKRTAHATIKIAVDMMQEGILTKQQALDNIEPEIVEKVLHPSIDPRAVKIFLSKGLPASPGAAFGKIALSSSKAEIMARHGEVILVRNETNPEDIGGIGASSGILTARGGMTSHAAVVARGMGKPCVTGAFEVMVDNEKSTVKINNTILKEGELITINGSSGEIFLGKVGTIQTKLDKSFENLIEIAEEFALLKVMANAETIKDAKVAKNFNACGIGLCRTEHMFFQEDRINIFREMILSQNLEERSKILNQLLFYQEEDFYQLFKIMSGLPVTIRLLDPPLHEFFPQNDEDELGHMSQLMSLNLKDIKNRVNSLKEANPMLGHRGCRLAITYPEIYQMQVKAILRATHRCIKESIVTIPEIMVPLVMNKAEFMMLKSLINDTANTLEKELNTKFVYKLGSMIELPAAVINAGEIASEADFISFGTNDLTQTCLGISRDDAGKFLRTYMEKGIFFEDPFSSIHEQTVGELLKMAVISSKKHNPAIKIGICGEHAGDPASIKFFNKLKIDYISCSPFRIPIAKVSAGKYNAKV